MAENMLDPLLTGCDISVIYKIYHDISHMGDCDIKEIPEDP